MSNLVIVESPAKAKTIKKYLGKDYEVVASMGHVRDLPKARLAVDIKKNYTPKVKKTKACQSCSLKNLCLPKLEKTVSVKKYMSQIFEGDRK